MEPINKYHTFWRRLLAGLLDSFLFIPLSIVDFYVNQSENILFFITWRLVSIICWMIYIVIGHGKYGQTLGKKVMQIRVLDIGEQKTIGYWRAFIRESVWVIADISGLIYLAYASYTANVNDRELIRSVYEDYTSYTILVWFLLELITMLFNSKRRAFHDYIARSVVVNLN